MRLGLAQLLRSRTAVEGRRSSAYVRAPALRGRPSSAASNAARRSAFIACALSRTLTGSGLRLKSRDEPLDYTIRKLVERDVSDGLGRERRSERLSELTLSLALALDVRVEVEEIAQLDGLVVLGLDAHAGTTALACRG